MSNSTQVDSDNILSANLAPRKRGSKKENEKEKNFKDRMADSFHELARSKLRINITRLENIFAS